MAKKILKILGTIVAIVILLAVGLIAYLTVAEYNPEDEEPITVMGVGSDDAELKTLEQGKAITIMTWNIGYGALGDNADFFMDGGTGVMTADEDRVNSNIANITSQIRYQHPDLVLLQEVDRDSKRSHNLDEAQRILTNMPEMAYTYATNYRVAYVPYPWPPMGKVDGGIMTLSGYAIDSATRVQLPIAFSWPIRVANLKRCLAVNRIPVEGTDKELVLINLHLEAYDDGEGKIAQTNMLNQVMQDELDKGNYVIAGGDFNQIFDTVDGSVYPTLEGMWHCGQLDTSAFDSSWQFIMDNQIPSCRSLDRPYIGADHDPQVFQYYLIDGFIVSPNIEIMEYETKDMGFQYTDHNPIVMKVKLTKE